MNCKIIGTMKNIRKFGKNAWQLNPTAAVAEEYKVPQMSDKKIGGGVLFILMRKKKKTKF
jgi:hypothetical protein